MTEHGCTIDDEADGEGDGEDEADGTPDECPESSRDEDGEGGEPGVAAIDVGFDVVSGDQFEEGEGGGDEEGVLPSMEYGDGEQDGSDGGDGDSDVGDEAAEDGEGSEENGVRKADEVEGGGDEGSEDEIDGNLEEEVARDAAAGVAHGLSHEGEVAVAGETDDTIAEIFTLKEHEEGEDYGEGGGGEGFDDAAELIETPGRATNFANLKWALGGGADGFLLQLFRGLEGGGGGGVDDAEFVAEFLEFTLRTADGGVVGSVERVHF